MSSFLSRRTMVSALAAPFVARPQNQAKPNIVFILLDDLGYADLGCFGQTRIKTPHLDQLCREGLKFTDAYAGGAVCAPSRCTMMTGMHQGHAAVRANAGTAPLLPSDVTFVSLLKKAGYTTGGFGKWGLGDVGSSGAPERHGFDQFFGYIHQTHAHDYYTDFLWDTNKRFPLPGNANGGRKTYSADVISEKSLNFVRRNKSKPFFLFATYTLPHANYEVPDQGIYTKETWPETEKNYAAMVTKADRMVGNLVSLLRELRLEENTLILFASDNGAPSGEAHSHRFFQSTAQFRGYKGQLYEGGIRVPAFVKWPGKIRQGLISDVPWAFCDIFPTLMSAVGLTAPKGLDGRNLMPLFLGSEKQSPNRMLYWESWGFDFNKKALVPESFAQAARWGEWKAVRPKGSSTLELYQLSKDIAESHNVAGEHKEVAGRMEQFLTQAHVTPRTHAGGSRQWVT